MELDLEWLPERLDWQEALAEARSLPLGEALPRYRALAATRMDLARTVKLDRAVQAHLAREAAAAQGLADLGLTEVRLALLGSSTLGHLVPAIRIAGLRRGLLVHVYEGPYGTYRQELADPGSGLHAFRPTAILLALDARHIVELERAHPGGAIAAMRSCWQTARSAFTCAVIQQTAMPVFPALLGNQEHRLPDSPASLVERINAELRAAAAQDGVQLLALDHIVREEGLRHWHEAALWHRSKQEVHPAASPLYGEQVARVLAALAGQTAKCLVLDLDNTLWGGVIGDDGLEGIVLGQGSAAGEAYLDLQRYALALKSRGIVLAVCSKNDEANALLPFTQHPETLLHRGDFACFVANWDDKATNLRRIARELNIGLDTLVFVDDNPAERALIRRELPMVAVPELPEDPAEFVRVLAAAGYFEGLGVTDEDRARAELYAANAQREAARNAATEAHTDLEGYLAGLGMELHWRPFDDAGRARIVQLINKTNQFNLTTRRTVDAEIERLAARRDAVTLQLRLKDIYGDNGMIAVVIAEPFSDEESSLMITDWLMSCRVLGRQVEEATLNLLIDQARARNIHRIFGRYTPTAKNAMVRDLYARLGFSPVRSEPDGSTLWSLDIAGYRDHRTQIACFGPQTQSSPELVVTTA